MKTLVCALLLSSVALAEESGQRWSHVGGRTVGSGATEMSVDVGWPGLNVGYLHGVASGVDLGFRASFMFGIEGMLSGFRPGVKTQFLTRFRLLDGERTSLALTFEPGAFLYSGFGGQGFVGVALPLGLRLGYATSSAVHLGLSLDVPVWIVLTYTTQVNIPILAGLGTEYFLTSNLLVFARVRMGRAFS